jgi:hypothetical protein
MEKSKKVDNKKDVYLPPDCIGEVISFLEDQETFFKIYGLSKSVKWYIQNKNPLCARNVLFKMYKCPKDKKKKRPVFVYRVQLFVDMNDDFELKFLNGIKQLDLSYYGENLTVKGWKNFTKLINFAFEK